MNGVYKQMLLGLVLMVVPGCFTGDDDDPPITEPVAETRPPPPQVPSVLAAGDHCYKWPFDHLPPLYLPDHSIMVTRILDSCVTLDGEAGYGRKASWMAMGFPCTKGPGKVEWKGHSYNPKMLSFIVSNSCPMTPPSMATVKPIAVSTLGLTAEAELLAYYPFSVQFWELPNYQEADTGHVIEVRSEKAVMNVWRDFRKSLPIQVRLFGRENTWVKGRQLFKVEAELTKTGQASFVLKVLKVQPLDSQQVESVRSRCETLRPARNCDGIFAL